MQLLKFQVIHKLSDFGNHRSTLRNC